MDSLTVLSFNCWGLMFTPRYKRRLAEIAEYLHRSRHDLILLQEVYFTRDITLITHAAVASFPFFHYFYSGVVGSGLLVLSRFPIATTCFFPFSNDGLPYHAGGDWFAGKGIGYCIINHPIRPVHLFATHLQAKYHNNEFEPLRALQLCHFASVINAVTRPNEAVIVAGDFNTEAHEKAFLLFLQHCQLDDACFTCHKEEAASMFTCNSNDSSYMVSCEPSRRIDYILYRSSSFSCHSFGLTLDRSKTLSFSCSDHKGIEANFSFNMGYIPATSTHLSAYADDLNSTYHPPPPLEISQELIDDVGKILTEGKRASYFSIRRYLWVLFFMVLFLASTIWDGLHPSYLSKLAFYGLFLLWTITAVSQVFQHILFRQQNRAFKEAITSLVLLRERYTSK